MSNETKWYTVKVQFNHEQKVSDRISLEMGRLNKNININIPKERIFSAKDGKKVAKEKALYPGYIFVETDAIGELATIVKETAGASNILKSKEGSFITLRKSEVIKMLNQKEELESPYSNELYIVGETVNILTGPFQTFKGKIDSIDNEKRKLKVLVSIFKTLTPVDLDYEQVSKI